MADFNKDILPEPDPEIPQQDELGKLPVSSDETSNLPIEEGDEEVLSRLDEVQDQLEHGLEQQDDGEALDAGELPSNEPEPFDATILPEITAPSIVDSSSISFSDEFGGDDFAASATSEESPARVPELDDLDTAQRGFDQMGQEIEAFHAQGGMGGGSQVPGDEAANEGVPQDDDMRNFLDADYRHKNTSSSILTDATQKINELTEKLERSRL